MCISNISQYQLNMLSNVEQMMDEAAVFALFSGQVVYVDTFMKL